MSDRNSMAVSEETMDGLMQLAAHYHEPVETVTARLVKSELLLGRLQTEHPDHFLLPLPRDNAERRQLARALQRECKPRGLTPLGRLAEVTFLQLQQTGEKPETQ